MGYRPFPFSQKIEKLSSQNPTSPSDEPPSTSPFAKIEKTSPTEPFFENPKSSVGEQPSQKIEKLFSKGRGRKNAPAKMNSILNQLFQERAERFQRVKVEEPTPASVPSFPVPSALSVPPVPSNREVLIPPVRQVRLEFFEYSFERIPPTQVPNPYINRLVGRPISNVFCNPLLNYHGSYVRRVPITKVVPLIHFAPENLKKKFENIVLELNALKLKVANLLGRGTFDTYVCQVGFHKLSVEELDMVYNKPFKPILKKVLKNIQSKKQVPELLTKIKELEKEFRAFVKLLKKEKFEERNEEVQNETDCNNCDEEDCPVCLELISSNKRIKPNCAHLICGDCYKKCAICPLCRKDYKKFENLKIFKLKIIDFNSHSLLGDEEGCIKLLNKYI